MALSTGEDLDIGVLHEVGSLMAQADALHEVLGQVVDFAVALVNCDSCFIYVLENDELRGGIKTYSNWPTIPQLYVKGAFVGGCDIIREMFQAGELQQLLADKGVTVNAAATA